MIAKHEERKKKKKKKKREKEEEEEEKGMETSFVWKLGFCMDAMMILYGFVTLSMDHYGLL